MTKTISGKCNLRLAAAKYAKSVDDPGYCAAQPDSQAKYGVCGWKSPLRCGRHAKQALAKHNSKRHQQDAFPFAKERAIEDQA